MIKVRHPRRVIEALSQRFMDKPEGDLLKILGFFDRPADIEAIKKIIEQPVIKDLTCRRIFAMTGRKQGSFTGN